MARYRRGVVVGGLAAIVLAIAVASLWPKSPTAEPLSQVSPAPTIEAGGPISARAERDGVLVTIALEHDRLSAGVPLNAIVTVTNLGQEPVSYQSGGCGLQMDFSFDGPEIVSEAPPLVQGNVGLLAKWSALSQGVGHTWFVPPGIDPTRFTCTADLRVDQVDAGAVETVIAQWSGTTNVGTPAPAGDYVVGFHFPYLARLPKEQFRGDAIADSRPIEVELSFEVIGAEGPGVGPIQAMDLALADARVGAWLDGIAPNELNGGELRYTEGAWSFVIRTQRGDARIRVDGTSGRVIDVGGAPGP